MTQPGDPRSQPELLVAFAEKRGHRYVLAFQPDQEAEAIRAVARWVEDPDSPLSLDDVAKLVGFVLRGCRKQKGAAHA